MNKVIVFCNNRMAIPALQAMTLNGVLEGIGIPETNHELEQECRYFFEKSNIPIRKLQRKNLVEDTLDWLETQKASHVFLMTFPWKIPAQLLAALPNKFLNFHYGLLPQMRGVDPIFESIRSKCSETGITVHIVTPEIDKGPILMTQKISLNKNITHGVLCNQMAHLNAQMSQQLISLLRQSPVLEGTLQSEQDAAYYKRPDLNDVKINWQTMDSSSIDALTRACNPWNKGAYSGYGNWNFRILAVSDAGESNDNPPPGTIFKGDNNELLVHCMDNRKLHITIIHSDEGFFEGSKLFEFGIRAGSCLN